MNPPAWSDEYYARKGKQAQLDQIVDVPLVEYLHLMINVASLTY